MHQAKIPGMESISKPRLMIEIYTYQEILSTDDLSIDGLSFPPLLAFGSLAWTSSAFSPAAFLASSRQSFS
jgi:hypothetical protein